VAVGVSAASGAERPHRSDRSDRSDRSEQGRRLLDEAVRLLDAVQSADASATHGTDCRWCPVCRGAAALRELDPEAVTRVATAVGDLAGAVRDLLSGPRQDPAPERVPGTGAGDDEGPPTVQRIVVGE
jgi:hypothetical protein